MGKCIFSWLYCAKIGIIHKFIIMSKTRRQKEKIIMIFLKLTVVTHCSSVVYSQEDHKQVVMIYFFPLQILFLLFQILYRILKKKKKKIREMFQG